MSVQTLILQPVGPTGEARAVEASPASIGRAADATCRIDRDGISRMHARLHRGVAGWSVEDLGSTNGTRVNWLRIEPGEQVPLREGDVVGLGSEDHVVRLMGPDFPPGPPPPPREGSGPAEEADIDDEFRTRGSLVRLGHDDTAVREVSWRDFYGRYVPSSVRPNAGCASSAIDDIIQVMSGFFGLRSGRA